LRSHTDLPLSARADPTSPKAFDGSAALAGIRRAEQESAAADEEGLVDMIAGHIDSDTLLIAP
jgi:hypothetical protein